MSNYIISLWRYPSADDWARCKALAMNTVFGKKAIKWLHSEIPGIWKTKILKAKHSPIRTLMFTIQVENVPYWLSTHFARHKHTEPYIASQRNDRQDQYNRDTAPQNAPVSMVLEMNAEEFITVAQKRLCSAADPKAQELMQLIVDEVAKVVPEIVSWCVPPCRLNLRCLEPDHCARLHSAIQLFSSEVANSKTPAYQELAAITPQLLDADRAALLAKILFEARRNS